MESHISQPPAVLNFSPRARTRGRLIPAVILGHRP